MTDASQELTTEAEARHLWWLAGERRAAQVAGDDTREGEIVEAIALAGAATNRPAIRAAAVRLVGAERFEQWTA